MSKSTKNRVSGVQPLGRTRRGGPGCCHCLSEPGRVLPKTAGQAKLSPNLCLPGVVIPNWHLWVRWGILRTRSPGFWPAGIRWCALPVNKLSDLFRRRKPEAGVGLRASVPADTLVVAVGDLHGQLELLETLWLRIADLARQSTCRHRTLVFVGDYVDRGPHSAELVDRLLDGFDGFETVFLKGNHDETLLQFLLDPSVGEVWRNFGGLETLRSYGVSHDPARSWADTRNALALAMPQAHINFFKNLKLHHLAGDYLFVHAGLRPHVRLEDQSAQDLLWIREEFLDSSSDFGRVVVHGHTPAREPEVRHNRIGIDTGAYMSGKLTALVLEGRERQFLST